MLNARMTIWLVVVVMVACGINAQGNVINSHWVGGDYGDWGNPSNWNPPHVPNNHDTTTYNVTIEGEVETTRVRVDGSFTINKLDSYGIVDIAGRGYLHFEGIGLTNYAEGLILDHIYVWGDIRNMAGTELHLEEVRVSGAIHNESGGYIVLDDYVRTYELHNSGLIIIVQQANPVVEEEVIINEGSIELAGGTLNGCIENNENGLIRGSGTIWGNVIINKGKIVGSRGALTVIPMGEFENTGLLKNTPSSSLQIHGFPSPGLSALDINNQGTMEVNAGGGIDIEGCLVNNSEGEIKLLGGTLSAKTFSQQEDSEFSGFGAITTDITIESGSTMTLTTATQIIGDVIIESDATLEVRDGISVITGHTTNNGTIKMVGGRVICQGGLDNNGVVINEPGLYNNVFDVNLDGKVNLEDFAEFAKSWLWEADF